jgi:hypothetical protein
VRRAALLAFAALAVGCGSHASGNATIWVTRDRGAVVVRTATVPAGLTAMQGLDRAADVSTRYGGRYVRSIEGVSEKGRSSWFYYVNGYLADRSAAEYKLRAGDVEWWDFRSWNDPAQDPVVVGAFPEPFLHGYDGHRRPAVVVSTDNALGRKLARLVHGRLVAAAPTGANVLEVVAGAHPLLLARLVRPQPGAPVRFVLDAGFARRLLADPGLVQRRYAFK